MNAKRTKMGMVSLLAGALLLIGAGFAQASVAYTMRFNDAQTTSEFGSFDTGTQHYSAISTLPSYAIGLAYNPTNSLFYSQDATTGKLFTINQNGAYSTPFGADAGVYYGTAFNTDGSAFWGYDTSNDRFTRIDPATGVATIVSGGNNYKMFAPGNLAYHQGSLYGSGNFTGTGTSSNLFRFTNPTISADVEKIAYVNDYNLDYATYELFSDGTTLYGVNVDDSTLVTIDPTNGAWSSLGTIDTSLPFYGVAYAPAVVPEPSTYALLCISLGVVGIARRKLRNTN